MSSLLRQAMLQLSSVSRLAGQQLAPQAPASRRSYAARAARHAVSASAWSKLRSSAAAKESWNKLIDSVADKAGLEREQADKAVGAALDTIVEAVAKGEKVEIPGFGKFESRVRAARTGINPATKEAIQIAETITPAFSAGKVFKDAVKGKQ